MALLAGNVLIDDDGNEIKSGMAEAIYDQLLLETNAIIDEPLPTGPDGAEGLRGIAVVANALAKSVVPYVLANLEVRAVITGGGDLGLQRTNDSGGACASVVDTLGPVFDKTLSMKATLL